MPSPDDAAGTAPADAPDTLPENSRADASSDPGTSVIDTTLDKTVGTGGVADGTDAGGADG